MKALLKFAPLGALLVIVSILLVFDRPRVKSNVGGLSYAKLIDHFVLEMKWVVGEIDASGECQLRFIAPSEDSSGNAEKFSALYDYVRLRSSMLRDIANFNMRRSRADVEVFEIAYSDDRKHCAVLGFRNLAPSYSPPTPTGANISSDLSLRYDSGRNRHEEGQVTIRAGRRLTEIALTNADEDSIVIVNSWNPISDALGKRVQFRYRDKNGDQTTLAVWDRSRPLPLLRSISPIAPVKLSVNDQYPSGNGRHLREGDSVFLGEGSSLMFWEQAPSRSGKLLMSMTVGSPAPPKVFERNAGQGWERWNREPTAFEADVVNALRNSPYRKKDIVLSIRPSIQDAIDSALIVAAMTAKGDLPQRPTHPLEGSIALLDAMSGAILGIASWPPRSTPRLSGRDYVSDDSKKDMAFLRRPIGSVAKIPFGLSVLSANPQLASLEIKPYDGGKSATILGTPISPPLKDHGCDAKRVGLQDFIRQSLNRYAATLLALGAVADPNDVSTDHRSSAAVLLGRDEYWLDDGVKRLYRPKSFYFDSQGLTGRVLSELAWAKQMKALFDVDLNADSTTLLECRTEIWRHAFTDQVDAETISNRSPRLCDISPERENLKLNSATSFRKHYIPLILGGGESRWSSVKVAESYARVVLGKRVTASIVVPDEISNNDGGKLLSSSGGEDVRRDLNKGMTSVAEDELGTGKWIRPVITTLRKRGLKLELYAKTGTPTIPTILPDPVCRAINGLSSAGRLTVIRGDAGRPIIQYDKKTILRGSVDDVEDEIRRKGRDAKYFKGVSIRSVLDKLAGFSSPDRSGAEDIDISGSTIRCRLAHDVSNGSETEDDGANFAFVALVRNQANEVTRAVAGAISLAPRTSSGPFQQLVEGLFWDEDKRREGPVARYLLNTD